MDNSPVPPPETIPPLPTAKVHYLNRQEELPVANEADRPLSAAQAANLRKRWDAATGGPAPARDGQGRFNGQTRPAGPGHFTYSTAHFVEANHVLAFARRQLAASAALEVERGMSTRDIGAEEGLALLRTVPQQWAATTYYTVHVHRERPESPPVFEGRLLSPFNVPGQGGEWTVPPPSPPPARPALGDEHIQAILDLREKVRAQLLRKKEPPSVITQVLPVHLAHAVHRHFRDNLKMTTALTWVFDEGTSPQVHLVHPRAPWEKLIRLGYGKNCLSIEIPYNFPKDVEEARARLLAQDPGPPEAGPDAPMVEEDIFSPLF
jgi:hypothetical protein